MTNGRTAQRHNGTRAQTAFAEASAVKGRKGGKAERYFRERME